MALELSHILILALKIFYGMEIVIEISNRLLKKLCKMKNKLCAGEYYLAVHCGCWGSFDSDNFKVSIFVEVDKNRYIFNARK